MTVNRKVTGNAVSIPAGLVMGELTSLFVLLAGTLISAMMINKGVLSRDHSGYAVMVILILSAWMGAAMTAGKVKRRRLMVCAAAGGIYFVSLLAMTALFFGGRYSGVGEGGLLILCGSALGFFLKYPVKQERKMRKMKRYHG